MTDRIKRILAANRIAHAYLFLGANGAGKKLAAQTFAASLNCLSPSEGGLFCGRCTACKKAANGNHPNIHILQPDGASLKLEQMKELKQNLSLRMVDEGYQVAIIDQADKMTAQAANSMLKVLEEPGGRIVFVLLAESSRSVLPTIISRCQKVTFFSDTSEGPEAGQLEQDDVPKVMLNLANGDRAGAVQLMEAGAGELREQVLAEVAQLNGRDDAQVLLLAEQWQKEDAEIIMKSLLFWYRDLLVWQQAGEERLLLNTDKINEVKNMVTKTDVLMENIEVIIGAMAALNGNANKRFTLENTLLQLAAANG